MALTSYFAVQPLMKVICPVSDVCERSRLTDSPLIAARPLGPAPKTSGMDICETVSTFLYTAIRFRLLAFQ